MNERLAQTADIGPYVHPAARLAAADEYSEILDLWIQQAFTRGDNERFAWLVWLQLALINGDPDFDLYADA